jgi:ATP-dependent protease Clp ATPase subunit
MSVSRVATRSTMKAHPGLEWMRDGAIMPIRAGEQKDCSFCKKTQHTARLLIASPDQRAYICDECAVEPSRLKVKTDNKEARVDFSPNPSSGPNRFLRKLLGMKQERCSFCRNSSRSVNLFEPAESCETQVQICANCLAVCRQIRKNEAENIRNRASSR